MKFERFWQIGSKSKAALKRLLLRGKLMEVILYFRYYYDSFMLQLMLLQPLSLLSLTGTISTTYYYYFKSGKLGEQ